MLRCRGLDTDSVVEPVYIGFRVGDAETFGTKAQIC